MTHPTRPIGSTFAGFRDGVARMVAIAAALALCACSDSADAPPPPGGGAGPAATAPAITQQPANSSVTAGQPASFTVAATGTTPLAYQWQRDGADIAGATATTYSVAATALIDSGATFRAVVSNTAGSVTSNAATLTVTASAPVLTITTQPANLAVVAGTQASFSVAATCSSGSVAIRWQRAATAGSAFADIGGAAAATYAFMTSLADSGAQFRAVLDCSGQSSTPSNAAALTVTAPGSATLALLPVTGLRAQAPLFATRNVDQETSGSYAFSDGNLIRRLSADLGTISIVANAGNVAGTADGPGAAATFNKPQGVSHDAAGNLYVADTGNHTIRRIAVDGSVSTLAGSPGVAGEVDGAGSAARFNQPAGIALGPDGDLYVSDRAGHRIRRVTTAGVVSTYAGSSVGFGDGAPLAARFNVPQDVAIAANGDVLVADYGNNRVRRIVRSGNLAGSVETLAGNGTADPASADGVGTAAVLISPQGLHVRGNVLTVRDGAGLVRQIDLTTQAVTTLTGSRALGTGFADGTATAARFSGGGVGITGAPNGAFIASDPEALRLIDAAGLVTTIATNSVFSQVDGVGTLAQLPLGFGGSIAVDPAGRVVVAQGPDLVRRIDGSGTVSLVAGLSGAYAFNSGFVDGTGSAAVFQDVKSIASSPAGVLYVSDGCGLRRIGTDGAVTLLAGAMPCGGVNGNGPAARFGDLRDLAVGPNGDIFAADLDNHAIRRIDAAGNVSTYAGVIGQAGNVDGPIASARLDLPTRLAFAPDGTLYVVVANGGLVRAVAADGSSVSTVPNLASVGEIAVDTDGTLYYAPLGGGLWKLPPGAAAATLVIAAGTPSVPGASPQLAPVKSMALLAPKQLVVITNAGELLVATLP